ncbi:MAG TPA: D-glycerate dehydrogenase [Candidatus Competibacter sp.]|nr:D-glycerate dehydrogenase [Gammaproteobacteria bacterium]HRX63352.1 D-glycerate dehydrogenase [Candidatus Competibacter sp.]
MNPHVVVYKKLPNELLAALRARFRVTYFEAIDETNRAAFLEAMRDADGLLGASVRLDKATLAPATRLKIVSTISVGYDTFDVDDLTERGILLAHTPGVLTETTADTIFALILATARRVVELAEFIKAGRWRHSLDESLYGVDVHSKTLGFLGMGRIGQAVARRARLGFNMTILYHNLQPVPEVETAFGARFLPLDEVLRAADFICVVLPLSPETEKLVGAREFALMRPQAIFINGSRGRIVDEVALIEALQQRKIHGAGLDVFEREPLPADSPLLAMPNVVALPHIGSATHETRLAMARLAVDNLIAGLDGERPRHLANGSVWSNRR